MFDILQFDKDIHHQRCVMLCVMLLSTFMSGRGQPNGVQLLEKRESCSGTPSSTATANVDSDACTVHSSGTSCTGSVLATVATDGTCVQSVGQSVSVTCSAFSTSTGSTSSNGNSGRGKSLYGLPLVVDVLPTVACLTSSVRQQPAAFFYLIAAC